MKPTRFRSNTNPQSAQPSGDSNGGGAKKNQFLRDDVVHDCCRFLMESLKSVLDQHGEESTTTIKQLVTKLREKATVLESIIPAHSRKPPPPSCVHERSLGPSPTPATTTPRPNIYQEKSIMTAPDVLAMGLQLVGFDAARQGRVIEKTNIERFKAFFGVPPTTVAPLFVDIKGGEASVEYKYCFMSLNWLYLYDTYPVLAGRFQHHENFIGEKVIEYTKKIQKLCQKTIHFTFNSDSPYLFTLDTVNFLCICNEMRLGE